MRNIIAYHAAAVLWILSSLTKAEYSSGSKDGFVKKSGFDSTYNGFLGEYAGHLGAGKVLSEHHDFGESSQLPPEHGSEFGEGESHNFSESFGEPNDDEDSSHFHRYSGHFESLKFPQDVEAHHYSGSVSSDIELGSNNHHNHHNHHHHHTQHHHFENHHNNYQFDEPAKSSDFKGYHSFEGTQIVPYSGNEETEEHEEAPPQYAGYEHSEENEVTKPPAKSYESAPKAPPASSYSHSFEGSKAPAPSYSHSFEDSKASKGSPSSYSHFYESSKPAITSHTHSYDSSKIPAPSSYVHSFESPTKSSYESHKTPSLSQHEPSLGSYGNKYQHFSAQEAPAKVDVISKYKSSGLKDFHSPLQKNIMTINHGKGGYSFSSLYRS